MDGFSFQRRLVKNLPISINPSIDSNMVAILLTPALKAASQTPRKELGRLVLEKRPVRR